MRPFLAAFDRQIKTGTPVVFWGGLALGASLGLWVASLENADLLFAGAWTRAQAVALLASVLSLVAVILFLPFEAAVACAWLWWPGFGRVSQRRLYLSAFVIGGLLLHALLWIHFDLVKDSTSARALVLSCSFLLAAVGLLTIVTALWPVRDSKPPTYRTGWLLLPLFASGMVGGWSYNSLAAKLRLTPEVTVDDGRPAGSDATRVGQSVPGPSVILISIDTLRPDHLGCYGYHRPTSPNIDGLAREGLLFRRARTQAPWTLPAHATLLTSLYPAAHGARTSSTSRFVNTQVADTLASWNLTLAEILQGAGLRTGAFTSGDWLSRAFGFDQGFGTFELHSAAPASRLVDKAMAWIDGGAGRFFLFLHLLDVHQYASPPEYDRLYRDPAYAGPLRNGPLMPSMNIYENLSPADLTYLIARYDGAVSYVDSELGRLFSWLRETGRYDDALVILTSDHGEEFWEHRGTGHGFTLYEEQLRVPLIIKPLRPPGRESGPEIRDVAAGLIDVVPTVLDYLGLPTCTDCQGISVRAATTAGRSLFAGDTYFQNSSAVMRQDYKYIENRIPPLNPLSPGLLFDTVRAFYKFRDNELYRLVANTYEQDNVIDDLPALASQMRSELLKHVASVRGGTRMILDDELREKLRSLGYVH